MSKLRGGVGVIHVGGMTPLELKAKMAKITDASASVRSALRGGTVPGGGVALLLASESLDDSKIEVEAGGDTKYANRGEAILKKAIQTPFKQILENADVGTVESMMENSRHSGFGYNVETEEFGDLIQMGVIDPANVVKAEVSNAVSSAIMVSNLGGAIVLLRDDKKKEQKEGE